VIALFAGVFFGFGLAFSGMMQPAKVQGFLDITGNWDASLIFVMVGALTVFSLGYHFFIKKRSNAWNGEKIHLPTNKIVDSKLIAGSLLFGAGWGLAGICPGPAIAMLAVGSWPIATFIAAMMIGMLIADYWLKKQETITCSLHQEDGV
jgi:uncharacterized protein